MASRRCRASSSARRAFVGQILARASSFAGALFEADIGARANMGTLRPDEARFAIAGLAGGEAVIGIGDDGLVIPVFAPATSQISVTLTDPRNRNWTQTVAAGASGNVRFPRLPRRRGEWRVRVEADGDIFYGAFTMLPASELSTTAMDAALGEANESDRALARACADIRRHGLGVYQHYAADASPAGQRARHLLIVWSDPDRASLCAQAAR